MSYSFQLKSIHIDVGNGPLFVAVFFFFQGSSIPSERADAEVRKEKKNKKRLFTSWLMSVQTSGLYKGTRRNKFNSLKTKLKWIFFFPHSLTLFFNLILFNFFPPALISLYNLGSMYPPHLPFYLCYCFVCLRAWVRAPVVPYCSMLIWPSSLFFLFIPLRDDWRDPRE